MTSYAAMVHGYTAASQAPTMANRRLPLRMSRSALCRFSMKVAHAPTSEEMCPTLPVVYALAALGGLVLVFDAPGRQTLTFQMVGADELQNAVALNSGLFNASRVRW